jgi:hypothetical protein
MPESNGDCMTREEFITAAEIGFEKLLSPTLGLPATRFEEPLAKGKWSLKDLAAHLAFWDSLTLRALEARLQGKSFDWARYADIDTKNAAAVEARRSYSAKQVMSELRITHSALMEAVRRVPDAQLLEDGEIPRWLDENVTAHYAQHAPLVAEWAARAKAE